MQFKQLLKNCKQNWVHPDFTETRWPLEPVTADEDEYEVVEHHFAETLTVEEGLCRLAAMADKGEVRLLAGSRLAMKYIAAHLDVQLDHPVILPLRAQGSDGGWAVPVFSRDWHGGDRRDLYLFGLGGGAGSGCGWLFLRKRNLDTRSLGAEELETRVSELEKFREKVEKIIKI